MRCLCLLYDWQSEGSQLKPAGVETLAVMSNSVSHIACRLQGREDHALHNIHEIFAAARDFWSIVLPSWPLQRYKEGFLIRLIDLKMKFF